MSRLIDHEASRLPHSGSIKEKKLRKTIESVSTVPEAAPFGVTLAFAVDRLRDLARRSFLARRCLAAEPDVLWPFAGSVVLDAALADDTDRDSWRQRWRDQMTALGAGAAAEAVPKGADPLAWSGRAESGAGIGAA